MKVAIVGSGISGSTLYKLIKDVCDVDLFGRISSTACGMKSCAWGVDRKKFIELCEMLGLDAKRYFTNYCSSYFCSGFKMKCDVVVIDKKLLLQDLNGDEVLFERPVLGDYDRIIDATGTPDGKVHKTIQFRVGECLSLAVRIGLFPLHCKWSFPIDKNTSHIGILSFNGNVNKFRKLVGGNVICQCSSQVYCGGLVDLLVNGNTWKIGEAAGAIDSITGSGILPAMVSALLLYKNWGNSDSYEAEMVNRFGYTRNLFRNLFHNEYRGLKIKLPCGWKGGTK